MIIYFLESISLSHFITKTSSKARKQCLMFVHSNREEM